MTRSIKRRPHGIAYAALAPLLLATAFSGCANWTPVPAVPESGFANSQTKTRGDVSVSVSILSDEEARTHFGVDLGDRDLQALWVSIRNGSPRKLWLIRNLIDRDFYSADETALLLRSAVPKPEFERLRQLLRDESVRVQLQPRTITEGFVFLPKVEGGRYIDVRLVTDAYEREATAGTRGDDPSRSIEQQVTDFRFGFALPLPDGIFDYERLDPRRTYDGVTLPDLDATSFRAALEELPCCARDASEENDGDPLNVVIVGESHDVLNSLSRSGWSFTHRITPKSVRRMIGAAVSGEPYPVAPVSDLFLFGRKQDFALQRARVSIAQRNHMRFWLAPFTYEGKQVWIGQISRDIGIKLSSKSASLTTHIIDPEVDLAREYLLHSLLGEGFVAAFGFLEGSKSASREDPAQNLTDDNYFSDGLRLLVLLSPDPVPYSQVRNLLWEKSAAPVAEGQTDSAHRYVRPIENETRESR